MMGDIIKYTIWLAFVRREGRISAVITEQQGQTPFSRTYPPHIDIRTNQRRLQKHLKTHAQRSSKAESVVTARISGWKSSVLLNSISVLAPLNCLQRGVMT